MLFERVPRAEIRFPKVFECKNATQMTCFPGGF